MKCLELKNTFSLHGIPEHLLAWVDPGLTGVWIGYGRLHPAWLIIKYECSAVGVALSSFTTVSWQNERVPNLLPPFCGQGKGLVWGGLLVWGRHHVCRVHLGGCSE